MLDELAIRGLGVIDEAVLPLGPGLTVVTGETGAGKTMVVTGLLLLFGGRADPARVRSGSAQASVEGRLLVSGASRVVERVREAGGDVDGDLQAPGGDGRDGADRAEPDADHDAELVLRRVVSAAGRSRAYVGGAAAPVSVLADLADDLVAVHGQSDQLRLARPEAQRAALDRFAGIDTTGLAAAFARWRAAEQALSDRTSRAAELRREADLLGHGLAEIETTEPQPGELDELNRLAARLGHADALTQAARGAHDALLGDSADVTAPADVTSLLALATRGVSSIAGDDPELDALADRLTELSALAADLGAEFGAYADGLDADPQQLEQVENRRAALNTLVRKYCDEPEPGLDAVLRWAEAARSRLADLDVSDEALAGLRAARDTAATELAALCADISGERRRAAGRLAAAVTVELAGLAMADASVEVEVGVRTPGAAAQLTVDGVETGVTADGIDEVALLLRPHPSAPALPVGKGASGGELSRVMLAIEVVLLGAGTPSGLADGVPTLVFDEVDAGVGGRAAVEVGRRLRALAADRQVLVVTHLAQVAAFADRHVVVDKSAGSAGGEDGVADPGGAGAGTIVASDIRLVEGDDRTAELARMLAGSDTPTARRHAAELLAESAAESAAGSAVGTVAARSAPTRKQGGRRTVVTAPATGDPPADRPSDPPPDRPARRSRSRT